MKISKTSWHYRWYNYILDTFEFRGRVSNNLCNYFWGFLFTNFKAILLTTVALGLALVIGFIALAPFIGLFISDELINLFGFIVPSLGVIGASCYLLVKADAQYSFTNVTVEYVKGVKGQYCPRIEFTDD